MEQYNTGTSHKGFFMQLGLINCFKYMYIYTAYLWKTQTEDWLPCQTKESQKKETFLKH